MDTSTKQFVLKVEASAFGKQLGDPVRKGELLGRFAGDQVTAPCNGTVKGVSFDPVDHVFMVVIEQAS
ncbi:MAG: hypothetical protein RBT80_04485 [Candidatus Vecturithrix sp.]|jgi:hypothetical protein|nr:hypothetical protein [Candidatus Vecturithrix sp.]